MVKRRCNFRRLFGGVFIPMSWNYRIVRRNYRYGSSYSIHETFYENGVPFGISENPIAPFGEDLEELETSFELMKEAFKKDILEYSRFNLYDHDFDEPYDES